MQSGTDDEEHYACRAWSSALQRPSTTAALCTDAARIVGLKRPGLSFWCGMYEQPRCLLEQLALAILKSHMDWLLPEDVGSAQSRKDCDNHTGVEWWVQHRQPLESISLHFDTDQKLKTEEQKHVSPSLATVTYLTDGGAPTLILPIAASVDGRWYHDGELVDGAFLSYPRVGKHLAFDARLLHGAEAP